MNKKTGFWIFSENLSFLYGQKINKTQVDIVVILWYNKINKEKGKFLNIFVVKEQIL